MKAKALKGLIYFIAGICVILAIIPVVLLIACRVGDKLLTALIDYIARNPISTSLNNKYVELRISEGGKDAE